MSVIGNVATLMDFAKRSEPDGKIQKIIELLAKENPVLKDMLWLEGNLPTGAPYQQVKEQGFLNVNVEDA